MRKLRTLSLIVCLVVFAVGASFADSLIGNLNLDTSYNTVTSVGTVIFTLNGDGTIGATLNTTSAYAGFGFNSVAANLPESGFTPTAPDNPYGWTGSFGYLPSGYYCSACGLQESWIIGNPGDYTSAWQALGGGNTVDFYVTGAAGEYAGIAAAYSPTPEPGSLMLLGTGALGVLGAIRRKLAR